MPAATNTTSSFHASTARAMVLDAYHAMYSVDQAAQQRVLRNHFDASATFEDPMMISYTNPRLRTAFASLCYVFKDIKPVVLSVTEAQPSPSTSTASYAGTQGHALSASAGGYYVVIIDAVIAYTLRLLPFITLKVRTLTKFSVHPVTNKIVAHHDIWSVTDMLNSVPLFGTLYTSVLRPFMGTVVDSMVRMFERNPKMNGIKN